MFIDRREFESQASRSAVPTRSRTLADTIGSAFTATRKTELSVSISNSLRDEYDKIAEDVFQQTGKRIGNPFGGGYQADPQKFGLQSPLSKDPEGDFYREASEAGATVPNAAEVRDSIRADRDDIREYDRRIQAGEQGFIQGAARFAGTAGAILTDPPIMASMLVGAGVASGILRTALVEGAIATGVEIPVQALVQSSRKEVGEEPNLKEAATNVALAGAGGAIGGALIKGVALGSREAVRRYRGLPDEAKTPQADAAATHLERVNEIEEAAPNPDDMPAYVKRFDETYKELLEGPSYEVKRTVRPEAPEVRSDTVLVNSSGRAQTPEVKQTAVRERLNYERAQLQELRKTVEDSPTLLSEVDNRLGLVTQRLEAEQPQINTVQSQGILGVDGQPITKLVTDRGQFTYRVPEALVEADYPKLHKKLKKADRRVQKWETLSQAARDFQEHWKNTRGREDAFAAEIRKNEGQLKAAKTARAKLDEELAGVAKIQLAKVRRAQAGAMAKAVDNDPDTMKAFKDMQAVRARVEDNANDSHLQIDDAPPPNPKVEIKEEPVEQFEETIDSIEDYLKEQGVSEVTLVGDDGNIKTLSGKALADDLKDDENLIKELKDCVIRAAQDAET